mmetsp:Transcript_36738/g.118082  ORF Transcript_36738/g.118082 Transcript_36738/m.118082 type:complete len:240 (-) Transcript_36738:1160-1879(-)
MADWARSILGLGRAHGAFGPEAARLPPVGLDGDRAAGGARVRLRLRLRRAGPLRVQRPRHVAGGAERNDPVRPGRRMPGPPARGLVPQGAVRVAGAVGFGRRPHPHRAAHTLCFLVHALRAAHARKRSPDDAQARPPASDLARAAGHQPGRRRQAGAPRLPRPGRHRRRHSRLVGVRRGRRAGVAQGPVRRPDGAAPVQRRRQGGRHQRAVEGAAPGRVGAVGGGGAAPPAVRRSAGRG